MMKNRKMVKGIALGAMIAALAAGGTAAYLTDFETTTNSFTVGKVDIELDEPGWKPEENTKIVPTQVIKEMPWQKQNFSVMQRTMTGHSWKKRKSDRIWCIPTLTTIF